MSARRLAVAVLAAAIAVPLFAVPASAEPSAGISGVRLIGEQRLPNALDFQGTTVGGLSSIDYDRRTGEYVFICDDRSANQPARFYTARIGGVGDGGGLSPIELTGTKPLLRKDGTTYPPLPDNDPTRPQADQTIDPEELRVDPWTGDYLWSQEGERADGTLIDPSIRVAGRDGSFHRDLALADNSRMHPESGPRQNLGPEAITYAGLGGLVTSALEAPLLQDGPEATTEHGALSRISVQARVGGPFAQYAYPQEPVFAEPVPDTAFATTGVTAILPVDAVNPTRYLMLERSFVTGVGNKVRIFEIDTAGATNVLHTDSLDRAKNVRPVAKKLIADLDDFGLSTVDNIEGMTWGPALPNGERSLLLVSDDNFAASQVTQVVALGIR